MSIYASIELKKYLLKHKLIKRNLIYTFITKYKII